ncbi:ABC transporter substrate-binding protein [Paenibacillaceae bacterium]|nr:ABC transporter substrate-binding protein [Paenibacillaceae bacterium]
MAILLAVMVGLAACGTDSDKKEQAPAGENTTNGAQGTEDAAKGENETAATGDSAKDDEAAGQSETRIVKDEFGDVEIPAHPKRVAAIYLEDYLKALEVTPIVQWYHPAWGIQDYLGLDVPQFDISGSLEALLEQEPDLIIVDGVVDAAKYEQYSKIAPTYRLPEAILQDSTEILKTVANVLGVPEKAEKVVAAYEQKVADAKVKLSQAIGKETVAVIRIEAGEKTFALFGIKNRYTGVIYNKFGLEPFPMARDMEAYHEVISEEIIPELDADHIIIFPSNGEWDSEENKDAIAEMLDNPLWKSLPAVKNDQVYRMDRSHWQSGAITANSMKLDDLLEALVK